MIKATVSTLRDRPSGEAVCVCVCVCVWSVCTRTQSFQCFVTPRIVAHQVPLSWDFPGKNPGVGCHVLLQGIFPNPGIEPVSLALAGRFFTSGPPGKAAGEGGRLLKTPLDSHLSEVWLKGPWEHAGDSHTPRNLGCSQNTFGTTALPESFGKLISHHEPVPSWAAITFSLNPNPHTFIAWLRGTDLAPLSWPQRSCLPFLLTDTIFIHSSLNFLDLG